MSAMVERALSTRSIICLATGKLARDDAKKIEVFNDLCKRLYRMRVSCPWAMRGKTENKVRLEARIRTGVRVWPAWIGRDIQRRNGVDLDMKIFKL